MSISTDSRPPDGGNVAAFFDLDKTILATSAAFALRHSLRTSGMLSRRASIASVLLQLPYLLRGADENRLERMANRVGALAQGWDAAGLEDLVAQCVDTALLPQCYLDAIDEIAVHQAAGHAVVLASASVGEMVRPISRALGASHAIGSVAEVDDEGCYTGLIRHFNYAEEKARACAELAAENGWDLAQCWAYSDSATDLPLLELVGHPVAVNPDHALAAIARERKWPIVTFSDTLNHGRHTAQIAAASAAAVGIGLAVAIGYVAWRSRRR